jgi:hypothetical protein
MKTNLERLSRKVRHRSGAALAAAAAQLLCAGAAGAQTRIGLTSQSRNGIFSPGSAPVTFSASGPASWAFTIPSGSAPAAPVSGGFWVSNGKLWWHNGTRPVAFVNDDGSGSGAVAWSALGSASGNLLLNTNGYSTTLFLGATSGAAHGFRVTDTAGNAGIGILGHFTTASGSQATPWQADANGTGWQVDMAGRLRTVGSTASGAITLSGSDAGGCTLTVPATGGALTPGAAAECDLGSAAAPIANFYLAGSSAFPGSNSF